MHTTMACYQAVLYHNNPPPRPAPPSLPLPPRLLHPYSASPPRVDSALIRPLTLPSLTPPLHRAGSSAAAPPPPHQDTHHLVHSQGYPRGGDHSDAGTYAYYMKAILLTPPAPRPSIARPPSTYESGEHDISLPLSPCLSPPGLVSPLTPPHLPAPSPASTKEETPRTLASTSVLLMCASRYSSHLLHASARLDISWSSSFLIASYRPPRPARRRPRMQGSALRWVLGAGEAWFCPRPGSRFLCVCGV